MVKMNELIGRELQWMQPTAMKQEYELRLGDVAVCSLQMSSSFNSRATAVNAEGSWDFDRHGFWQRQVTIRETGGMDDLALFNANTWKQGGTIILPNGRNYIASSNFWMTQHLLTTSDGQNLISSSNIRGVFHYSCDVEIHSLARSLPELPWLVPLGWYLIMMQYRDSAAAAAAT
jgi:hypothetical protein